MKPSKDIPLVQPSISLAKVKISGIRKFFERAGKVEGMISLGIGAPDLMPPKALLDAVTEAMKEKQAHSYSLSHGILELREKISQRYQTDLKLEYDPENICISAGGTEMLFTSIFALTNPGDEIIIPDPGFVYYPTISRIARLKVKAIPLDDKNQMPPESVQEAITDKTRLIITNSPSNPTGSLQTKDTIKGIAEHAIDKQIPIISDEVYENIIFNGKKFHSFAQFAPEHTIILNSFSKSYSIPGWRLGYACGTGELMTPLKKFHTFVISNPPSLLQYALCRFFGTEADREFQETMRTVMERRADVCAKEFQKIDWLDVTPVDGSIYMFPKIKGSSHRNPGEEFVEEAFEKAKVVTVPGSAFGMNAFEHFRISFGGAPEEKLVEAANRIREMVVR